MNEDSLFISMMFSDALCTMAVTLAAMEKAGKSAEEQMDFCVWPILNESQNQIAKIKETHTYERGQFKKVVES